MAGKKTQSEKGAIEIVEEAAHQLRLQPVTVLACYYIGTLPFILGLLYFWADMSKSAFAADRCVAASLGLAFLFVWMKCWQAVFAGKMKDNLTREPANEWSLRRLIRLAATQTIIHATGFVVLPIALLLTIPYGWCYAFYQNIAVLGDGREHNLKFAYEVSWGQAKLWPRQNAVLLLIISGLGIIAFLNLGVIIFSIPHLLQRFLGIENMPVTSGMWFVFNTTFLAVTSGLAYLCIDPLIKTIYVLRCFYGSSLQTGEDLQAELKRLRNPGRVTMFTVLLFMAMTLAPVACLATEQGVVPPSSSRTVVEATDLDSSISKVLENPKYAWRLPRLKKKEDEAHEPGFLGDLIAWVIDGAKSVFHTIGRWFTKLKELLQRLMPDIPKRKPSSFGMPDLTPVAYILIGIVIVLFLWLAWPAWKGRRRKTVEASAITVEPVMPDIRDHDIRADEIAVNRWLLLAEELKRKGELRLALRALYLATLAHLAEQQMITIAKFKSNYDYMRELNRRMHANHDLVILFQENNLMFDKVWYGRHTVNEPEVEYFTVNHEQILAYAAE